MSPPVSLDPGHGAGGKPLGAGELRFEGKVFHSSETYPHAVGQSRLTVTPANLVYDAWVERKSGGVLHGPVWEDAKGQLNRKLYAYASSYSTKKSTSIYLNA